MFLSSAWVESWLAVFGPSVEASLWTARLGDEVVGAALLVQRIEWRGPIPTRCLYLNTAGEGADSVTVEHNCLLIKQGHDEMVWRELGRTLQYLKWDEFMLHGVTNHTMERTRRLFPYARVAANERAAPFVSLSAVRAHPAGLVGKLSANTRGQLRRAARICGASSVLTIDEGSSAESRAQIWSDLKRLHTIRRNKRGEVAVFSRERWVAFHQHLMSAAPSHTRLFRLRTETETLASLYLLQHGEKIVFYQSGIKVDPSDNRAKPGLLLHVGVIDRLALEGLEEYDFLASDEPEVRYKRSIATSERSLCWLTVFRPTLRSRIVVLLRKVRNLLFVIPEASDSNVAQT